MTRHNDTRLLDKLLRTATDEERDLAYQLWKEHDHAGWQSAMYLLKDAFRSLSQEQQAALLNKAREK